MIKDGLNRELKKTLKEREEYIKDSKGSIIKKVPNFLTRIRIIFSFIIPIITIINPKVSVIVTIIIALTDLLDGVIARKCNACSKYGALLDTVADKLLSLSLIISLMTFYPLEASLVLVCEIIIASINVYARIKGINTRSSILGKTKTWALSISAICGLISFIYPDITSYVKIIFTICIILQIGTIIDYIYYYNKNKA